MMKFLALLLLVVSTQAFVTETEVQKDSRSSFITIQHFDLPVLGLYVRWGFTNANFIGYRLSVWVETARDSDVYIEYQQVTINGNDHTLALVGRLQMWLWYRYQVQAITPWGNGPVTEMGAVKFMGGRRDGGYTVLEKKINEE